MPVCDSNVIASVLSEVAKVHAFFTQVEVQILVLKRLVGTPSINVKSSPVKDTFYWLFLCKANFSPQSRLFFFFLNVSSLHHFEPNNTIDKIKTKHKQDNRKNRTNCIHVGLAGNNQ